MIDKFDKLKLIKNSNSKVSSFLTIQEGCDKFCKFCVVPYTRGPEFSRSFKEILQEANQLIANGSREITLLGQNVNAYKDKNRRLSDVLYSLEEIKELKRIRYTTSHPKDMTQDLIQAHKDCKKLMPLLHLPVQSGSDKILQSMNRKHTAKEYLEIIDKLKKNNDDLEFTSDFIISYPGESENDFINTCDLMKKVKFINSYSFIYSPRPGTPAGELKIINSDISLKRLKKFQRIAERIKIDYKKKLLNNTVKVLFENKVKNESDKYFGRDKHQNPVIVQSNQDLLGKEKNVVIKKISMHTIYGEVVSHDKNLAA